MPRIKPLLIILSPRDIANVKEAYDKIDYVDKLWIKYYPAIEAYEIAEQYFREHKEYTHIIINCDDAIPQYEHIAMLIADCRKYNFKIISGCCCGDKVKNRDLGLNLNFNKAVKVFGETSKWGSYHQLPNEFRQLNGIIRVWFQGNAYGMIRRDIFKKIGFKPWNNEFAQDLRQAFVAFELGIQQFSDLRCYMEHFRGHKLLVGIEPPYVKLEFATVPIPNAESSEIITELPLGFLKLYQSCVSKNSTPFNVEDLKCAFSKIDLKNNKVPIMEIVEKEEEPKIIKQAKPQPLREELKIEEPKKEKPKMEESKSKPIVILPEPQRGPHP